MGLIPLLSEPIRLPCIRSLDRFGYRPSENGLDPSEFLGETVFSDLSEDHESITLRIPYSILDSLQLFYRSSDPETRLYFGQERINRNTFRLDLQSPQTLAIRGQNCNPSEIELVAHSLSPIPHSGQITCFDSDSHQACTSPTLPNTHPGQDGLAWAEGKRSWVREERELISGDWESISRDRITGLVWTSCYQGEVPESGNLCTGAFSTETYQEALDSCADLNLRNGGQGYFGKTNWRLPTAKEAVQAANLDYTEVYLDPVYFSIHKPTDPNSNFLWTGTENPGNSGDIFLIRYANGGTPQNFLNIFEKETFPESRKTRCVASPLEPNPSFVENSLSEVLDARTGLIWQKCLLGQSGNSCETGAPSLLNWQAGLQNCQDLGDGYRLPSAPEMQSLWTYLETDPTLREPVSDLFPGLPLSANYWTASSHPASPNTAFHLNEWGEIFATDLKSSTKFVRCVKNSF